MTSFGVYKILLYKYIIHQIKIWHTLNEKDEDGAVLAKENICGRFKAKVTRPVCCFSPLSQIGYNKKTALTRGFSLNN
jgi:ribosomal protein L13E